MSDAPDCLSSNKKTIIMKITLHLCLPLHCLSANQIEIHFVLPDRNIAPLPLSSLNVFYEIYSIKNKVYST